MAFVPRPTRHSVDKILDVSRDIVLRDGARGVTIDRIVATSGAPKGSVYHRFSTVNDLLGSMWLRGVRRSQARFLEPLGADGDPVEAAVAPGWPFTISPSRSLRMLGCSPRCDVRTWSVR